MNIFRFLTNIQTLQCVPEIVKFHSCVSENRFHGKKSTVIQNFQKLHSVLLQLSLWHSVEKPRNSLSPKKFRQINSLVTYLVNPLLSRNFWQKCVRGNSRNFHTVCDTDSGTWFHEIFFNSEYKVHSVVYCGNYTHMYSVGHLNNPYF